MLYSIKKISELDKILKKYCKKVCGKSCRKGKSLYLCNRFREGEPLKMTDWVKLRLWKRVPDAAPSILPCGCARERERISRTPSENLLKNFFKKKLSKKFGGYEKTPYLCKRFPAKTGARKKRQFFERLWINRLGCSTRSSPVYNK